MSLNNSTPFQKNSKICAFAPFFIQKNGIKKPSIDTTPLEPGFYRKIKKSIFFYRMVFLFLGILFLYLSGILFFQTPNWSFKMIFDQEFTFKALFVSITLLFGVASAWIGCSLRSDYESVYYLVREHKRKLKKAYYNTPMNEINKERYRLSKQEMEAVRDKILLKIDKITENPILKNSVKKAEILQLLIEEKKHLNSIVAEFTQI